MSQESQATQEKPRIPGWAWIFVVGCLLIPIITVGGAIPGAIGGGGAFGCVSIARDPSNAVATRVIYCAVVTGICWILFVAFMVAAMMLQGPAG
jgi:hypothetical protein